MKRHYTEPIARQENSIRAEDPDALKPLMEDPVAESRDMSHEQAQAFVPPDTLDERVEKSKGDAGRT